MLSLAIATASSSSRNVSTVSTGPNDSSWTTDMSLRAAVEHRRQVVEAVGQLGVVGPRAAAAQHARPRRARRRRTPRPCRGGRREISGPVSAFSSNGPPSRIGSARGDQLVDELVVDRLLDQQPGAGRADLAGVQEHRGQGEVEGRLEVGVGEDDVGVLAAELEGDLLHGRARRRP